MVAGSGKANVLVDNRQASAGPREFAFSDEHFQQIKTFVDSLTGIHLSEAKKDMVYGRLCKRVRTHFAGSFDGLCRALEAGSSDEQEFLINAITTNLTAFFRERHHFDYLAEKVIPELLQRNARSRRIRFWSAGCSTGEEAYSLAITLRETISDIDAWDIKILATDLNADVVAQGQEGAYRDERIEMLTEQQKKRWFVRGKGDKAGLVRVKSELRGMIAFKRLNLLQDWPMRGPFDVIFCRNVVIYFDKTTQTRLFKRYADMLRPQGHLFIGHSETLHQVSECFVSLGHTVYRQVAGR